MKASTPVKWALWVIVAAIATAALYPSTFLLYALRNTGFLEYPAAFMLGGLAANLLFKDTRILYLTAAVLPFLSAALHPDLGITLIAVLVAVIWGALSFLLGVIRRWI